ncbi:hypothetical protein GQ42DRAFT_23649 [Ramicandelaber brevisporus]|nr:hypothetical protein GQ42DRAFT_23649 [Ramicandelaber brevisporus]
MAQGSVPPSICRLSKRNHNHDYIPIPIPIHIRSRIISLFSGQFFTFCIIDFFSFSFILSFCIIERALSFTP